MRAIHNTPEPDELRRLSRLSKQNRRICGQCKQRPDCPVPHLPPCKQSNAFTGDPRYPCPEGLFKVPKSASPNLVAQRLAQCCHASECDRLCPRLVKGPGISQVACVNIETGEQRPLYESLEDPDFECPEGLF